MKIPSRYYARVVFCMMIKANLNPAHRARQTSFWSFKKDKVGGSRLLDAAAEGALSGAKKRLLCGAN